MINEKKLDFYIKHNYNVLIKGAHGVGKSAMIIDAFNRNNLKWLYFSASTMDPWVDFIGVPKEVVDEDGSRYLDLVRPKAFKDDQVEAIFFDEYNRASKKVRNAVMELIQFKSINGKKFNNLKVIWAAINPNDESDDGEKQYDVEDIDPAQLDRFQIIIEADNKPNYQYFSSKYGADAASTAIEWWKSIPQKLRSTVSPRRLDYILDIYKNDGDIKDAVPNNISTTQLIAQLKNGNFIKKYKELADNKDFNELRNKLNDDNFYQFIIDRLIKDIPSNKELTTCIPKEKFVMLIAKNEAFRKIILSDTTLVNAHASDLQEIINAKGLAKAVTSKIKEALKTVNNLAGMSPLDAIIENTWNNPQGYLINTQEREKWLNQFNAAIKGHAAFNPQLTADPNYVSAGILQLQKATDIIVSIKARSRKDTVNKKIDAALKSIITCYSRMSLTQDQILHMICGSLGSKFFETATGYTRGDSKKKVSLEKYLETRINKYPWGNT